MPPSLNIGLIDTPLSKTEASTHIQKWPGGPASSPSSYLSHSDINVGLLLGSKSVDASPILPKGHIYIAEAVQEDHLALRLLESLEWMAQQPVKVVAMPFGEHHGSPFMIPMIQHLLDKDILPVAAIGNKGAGQFSAPGCYQGVLSIGATDAQGIPATYSGSLNLQNGQCLKPDLLANGEVMADNRIFRGTSFATTRIAGYLASFRHKHPNVTCQQTINHTFFSCDTLPIAFKHRSRLGVLNLEQLGKTPVSENLPPRKALSITGKFTDPNLLRRLERSRSDMMIETIVCPKKPDLSAYTGIEVVRSFANDQILVIKASVSTLLMMHTQPDILVLQSQEIPPISILQLR